MLTSQVQYSQESNDNIINGTTVIQKIVKGKDIRQIDQAGADDQFPFLGTDLLLGDPDRILETEEYRVYVYDRDLTGEIVLPAGIAPVRQTSDPH